MKIWTKTRIQNLLRHRNGTYYARFYGKEQWILLKTDLFEVAKSGMLEHIGESKVKVAADNAPVPDEMTVGEAAAFFLKRLKTAGLGLRGKRSNRKRVTEQPLS